MLLSRTEHILCDSCLLNWVVITLCVIKTVGTTHVVLSFMASACCGTVHSTFFQVLSGLAISSAHRWVSDQVGEEVLGTAAKIEVTKENCTIVGDGSSEDSVKSRVKQIRNLVANTEQDYEKEKLNERIARLSGGVAIIQVRHWTQFTRRAI